MRFLMRASLAIALLAAASLVLPGCDNGPAGDAGLPLAGVLRDADQRPLGNAGILVEYSLAPPSAKRLRPQTSIEIQLGTGGHVRVWITRAGSASVLRTLIDGELSPGMHAVTWDGADDAGLTVVPGVYEAHVHGDEVASTYTVFWCDVEHDDLAALATLEGRRWHAVTRADGSFSIPRPELACGLELESRSEDGSAPLVVTVSWQVRVWAVSPGRGVVSLPVTVDPRFGAWAALSLP